MGQSLVKGLILEDFIEVVECLLYLASQGMVLVSYGIQFISSCSHM
jgi:hypothetical protein